MPANAFVKTPKSTANKAVNTGPLTSEMEPSTRSSLTLGVHPAVVVGPADADARRQKIAEAAYRRAERRGFAPGAEMDDWLLAEAEVDGSPGERSGVAG